MDQEPPKLLGVELHVRGVEGDGVRGDGLPAVPRHKDVALAGVGKGIVAVLVRVVDGGLAWVTCHDTAHIIKCPEINIAKFQFK